MTGSWARAWWSGACTEKEAGVRPVALARGPSWPGGGSSRHPYPRPASARVLTSFAFGTKQASGTHVSITPGGARRRGVSRRMSRGHTGSLLGLVGLGRPQRLCPCPSHRADSPEGGRFNGWRQDCSQRPGVARCLRLVSQTPACLAFRYLPPSFHRVLPAERSRPARGSA